MSYDYKPLSEKPNPMSRKQWEAMDHLDQANFINLGGTLFDEGSSTPKELETLTFGSGRSVTRGQWDAMSENQKAEFTA